MAAATVCQRGIRRQTARGSRRIAKKTGRSTPGTQTTPRRFRSAATVASATWSGVLENGAGLMPSVIRPMTNPGRTSSRWTPEPVEGVGEAAREAVEAGLRGAVDVVGAADADPGDRGEHDEAAVALGAQQVRGVGEDADLGDVVGVHDGGGVGGVLFGAGLVAEDAEGEHDDVERAVLGDDLLEEGAVRGEVVGVEVGGFDGFGPASPGPRRRR